MASFPGQRATAATPPWEVSSLSFLGGQFPVEQDRKYRGNTRLDLYISPPRSEERIQRGWYQPWLKKSARLYGKDYELLC